MAAVGADGPRPAIVLIGFMAAGKSAAAGAVAERLGLEAVDADELIERELGEPIPAFFEREGEAEFRRREEELVLSLLERGGTPAVIALGGGAVESERVADALGAHLPVWCRVDEETAWERASRDGRRPLAADRDEFARRFAAREPLYESLARAILPADPRDAAREAAPWLAAMREAPGTRMIWAQSGSGSYPAVVGAGALSLLDGVRSVAPDAVPARTFVVADREVLARHGALLPASASEPIEVEGSESSKTIAEAERVLVALAEAGARRDDLVLAFGGGVVGDLAGFSAATYQRGVAVVQAPTTLVGQVDSAYGGKTGVDLPAAKNYVGAYHLPLAVLADPGTLATLPREELAAGFVEVVKTALIAGGPLWERVRALEELDLDSLAGVAFECARTKIEVVAEDERDSGRRAVLNLGHTVGHAIEAASGYGRYRHGEAVGLGLLAALRLSGADGLRDEVAALLAAHDLPTFLDEQVALEEVMGALARDKKATARGLGFVLLERPGEPRWGQAVDPDRVRAAVQELYE
ncbi:MAG TPA: bifunctional shikimate kinase/3-dehydroquinate synthase [Solirubrobacterales bacterium]|jgi:shikimate kinase/3-dehydroquinate synthase|nr:bifunctional shikimate kinase/3-dehydroquinate synthase [Solirubrobacterales bacterium]